MEIEERFNISANQFVMSLLSNEAQLQYITFRGETCFLHGVQGAGEPLLTFKKGFWAFGGCNNGNELLFPDLLPEVAVFSPADSRVKYTQVRVLGEHMDGLSPRGICNARDDIFVTAIHGPLSYIIRLTRMTDQCEVTGEIMYKGQALGAIRYYSGRFYVIGFQPSPHLIIFQFSHDTERLIPVRHIPLCGYPVEIMAGDFGVFVTLYGGVAWFPEDCSECRFYNLSNRKDIRGDAYFSLAYTEAVEPGRFWLSAFHGKEIYKVTFK
ncbi:MAG: hypothetical protein HUN04_08510 [Desulfobacter sp.]|nr:MAG: hypothetical protein HUN04_08510 [Desulfobacter sp.]